MSFDRFRPTDAVQLELPWRAPDARSRVVRLTAAVDAINSRYGRTLIGYGQCGEPGGYVGAKIAYQAAEKVRVRDRHADPDVLRWFHAEPAHERTSNRGSWLPRTRGDRPS